MILALRFGDCVEVMRSLGDSSVSGVICDPPYGLEFMGAEWDRLGDKSHSHASTSRSGAGLPRYGSWAPVASEGAVQKLLEHRHAMSEWHVSWLRECFRVLAPGGEVWAFSGTRTEHRLVEAFHVAGFGHIRLEAWVYGSGFPKGLNIGKAIDGRVLTGKSDSPEAKTWRGWGTALKPAWEPVVIGVKPVL